jgi:hypothetical protein
MADKIDFVFRVEGLKPVPRIRRALRVPSGCR